jgi:hypothetical protein
VIFIGGILPIAALAAAHPSVANSAPKGQRRRFASEPKQVA